MEWTPPAEGSPCWIEIPAVDLVRVREFYTKVFNWNFKHEMKSKSGELDMVGFGFADDKLGNLGGGFRKVAQPVREGTRLYLYVADLEKTMEKIVANGGKKQSDVQPEGEFGLYMHAEDTEGNPVGIYTAKKKD